MGYGLTYELLKLHVSFALAGKAASIRRLGGLSPVASLGVGGGRTAPGDTLQGVTSEGNIFVGKFTKNSGETRSDR